MNSKTLRESFLNFFTSKGHKVIPSAPIVIKNDPTLMFTNAGMNQFKDIFLDNSNPQDKRVANSQKCLRVSGKHNDLEEVGIDTYHHTMFEMLGNWSFGDYFKENAIDWAWEFLTQVCKLDTERLYVTVFDGSKKDGIDSDTESIKIWKEYISKDRILPASKQHNFWEMGEAGPCGPCSEIHYDNRSAKDREKTDGKDLINQNHPDVIEIWNLVFIQYNRLSDGTLENLPNQHVDTGMGLERLCMIMQEKKSNYDTDIFQSIIQKIEVESKNKYGEDPSTDIAMRVIADHIRAVTFSIADGQLPSNVKAGYVIRRILRRSVRYAYTFLQLKEPFLYRLVSILVETTGDQFTEVKSQQAFIEKVIQQEEESFLRTLEDGLSRIEELTKLNTPMISGRQVFELYDTFGFPVDLTKLILSEKGMDFNTKEFEEAMKEQKNRSKIAAKTTIQEWNVVNEKKEEGFVGYNEIAKEVKITRYRKINIKNEDFFQIIFHQTPFYPEGGGQVGDRGVIISESESIKIIDTKKENELIIHLSKQLPRDVSGDFLAKVDSKKRNASSSNHTATHLLHEALRDILGTHVEQKGSLVSDSYLRFDFSHFEKIDRDTISAIENQVNEKIRSNISLQEHRELSLEEAKKQDAIMLFGEKYTETVRMIQFDSSKELCGGTHVTSTAEIRLFKIILETSIASGVRRIEALSGEGAINYLNQRDDELQQIQLLLKSQDTIKAISKLLTANKSSEKLIEKLKKESLQTLKEKLLKQTQDINQMCVIAEQVNLSQDDVKSLCFQLKKSEKKLVVILASEKENKAFVAISLTDDLVKKGLNAHDLIQKIGQKIDAKGGGQAFFAIAGGGNPKMIPDLLNKVQELIP